MMHVAPLEQPELWGVHGQQKPNDKTIIAQYIELMDLEHSDTILKVLDMDLQQNSELVI